MEELKEMYELFNKKLKSIIVLVTCLSLWFVQIGFTNFDNSLNSHNFSTLVRVDFNTVNAQMEVMEESAKSKTSKFVTYYLPMLVMLGVGLVSILIFRNLVQKSGDMIVFMLGGLVYFVSVIIAWTGEIKKFEKLPDKINSNTSVETLKLQKKSIEEVIEIAKKREKFQMAATAAFAVATIWAAVGKAKEKSLSTNEKMKRQAAIAEVSSACAKHPQFTKYPDITSVETGQNMSAACQHNATQVANVLNQIGKITAEYETACNDMIRSPQGSGETDEKCVRYINQTENLKYALGIPRQLTPARRKKPISANVGMVAPLIDPFHQFNLEVYTQMELIQLHRAFDPTELRHLHRYMAPDFSKSLFSEQELSQFTDKEITFIDKVFPNLNGLDFFIGSAHAGGFNVANFSKDVWGRANTLLEKGGGIVENSAFYKTHLGNFKQNFNGHGKVKDSVGGLIENASKDQNDINNKAMCNVAMGGDCDSKDMKFFLETKEFITLNLGNALAGSSIDILVNGIMTKVSSALVAKPGTVLMMAALKKILLVKLTAVFGATAVGAAIAGGKVALVVSAVVLTAMILWSIAKQAMNLYESYSKTSNGKKFNQILNGTLENLKDTWNLKGAYHEKPVLKFERWLNLLIPKANAIVPGVHQSGQEVVTNVSKESAKEMDHWLYNYTGRMILYGATTALTAIILVNTRKMIKNLEEDRDKLNKIIALYDKNFSNESGVQLKEKLETPKAPEEQNLNIDIRNGSPEASIDYPRKNNEIMSLLGDLIIPQAKASQNKTIKLPFKIPCMAPNSKGRCFKVTTILDANRNPFLSLSKDLILNTKYLARFVDEVQQKDYINEHALYAIDRLAENSEGLVVGADHAKLKLNQVLKRKFNVKPIDFEHHESMFIQNMGNAALRGLNKTEGFKVETLAFLNGGLIKRDFSLMADTKPNAETRNTKEIKKQALQQFKSEKLKHLYREKSKQNIEVDSFHNFLLDTGVEKDSDKNIFDIISRRYNLVKERLSK